MSKLEIKRFRCTALAHIPALSAIPVMGREPLEVARMVLCSAQKSGLIELYVDGTGHMAIRKAGIRYSDQLPDIWLVGTYTENASTVRIMEDLELRLNEVRAACG